MVAMIIALLSDVHSNLEALRACLAHAREQGVRRHAFLGDLVGYGADPAAVIEIVAEHASRGDLVVHIDVKVPAKLTREQRHLFEQLLETLPAENQPAEKGILDKVKEYFM